jgi:hypothetical protein
MLDTAPNQRLDLLCDSAAVGGRVNIIRTLLEYGAPWSPASWFIACRDSRFDILEIVLEHSREWSPLVPGVAGAAGNVRFLRRIFEAGCPGWTRAMDGEPCLSAAGYVSPSVYLPAKDCWVDFRDWSLVVSSDLVRSGPVLLLAAQRGVPLTIRMAGMLWEVRCRVLALAGSFHRAARLSRAPGADARKWDAMGRVPVEIIQAIATLARISIVAVDLVQ